MGSAADVAEATDWTQINADGPGHRLTQVNAEGSQVVDSVGASLNLGVNEPIDVADAEGQTGRDV